MSPPRRIGTGRSARPRQPYREARAGRRTQGERTWPVVEPGRSRSLLIRSARLTRDGGDVVGDVRIAGSRIGEVAAGLPHRPGEEELAADGGQLTPGLHDHHVHLWALAAASDSVAAGPPEVTDGVQLAAVLREADARLARGQWIRAVGYHESVAGLIDRGHLDAIVAGRPVRVQHRSGVVWILNSAALESLQLGDAGPAGLERDASGRPTGRLWREAIGCVPIYLDGSLMSEP